MVSMGNQDFWVKESKIGIGLSERRTSIIRKTRIIQKNGYGKNSLRQWEKTGETGDFVGKSRIGMFNLMKNINNSERLGNRKSGYVRFGWV